MKKTFSSRLRLISAMTIFGTIGIFVRNVPLSSGEIALYRAVIAVVILGAFLLITRQKMSFSKIKKELFYLSASGIAIGINWVLLFEAYKYTTVSLATLSYYFAPVIVTLVCPIIFRERLTVKQIVCFLASTLGLVLITGTGGRGGSDLIGILFGLGAAVFYAASLMINKFIKDVEGIHRTFVQFIFAIVVLVPYVLCTSGVTLENMNGAGWISLIILGVIHTSIPYCLYLPTLKELPGQEVAILCYADPLVAVIISVTVLGESMTLMQVIGGALILGFTLINEISTNNGKNDEKVH